MRLFFALWPPGKTAHALAQWLVRRLPDRLHDRGSRIATLFLDGFDSVGILEFRP